MLKDNYVAMVQKNHAKVQREEKAVKYSKHIARKNMWNNIKFAISIIILIMLFVLYGILESTIL